MSTSALFDATVRDALSKGLSGSELWSVLLAVLERRTRERSTADVLHQWEQDRFVRLSFIDQRTIIEIDRHLLTNAASFEALELSPLAPLGACSVVALTSQNRVVSTARGTEVVSDPTNVLALECAKRLRADPGAIVKLATSHRCVRAQPVPDRPGFSAHFRMFCLATAGHEQKDSGLLVTAVREHIQTHLGALDRLQQAGYVFTNPSITLLSTPQKAQLARRIGESLPDLQITYEPLTHEYYGGLRFMINAGQTHGGKIPLIDGGCFDWVAKLAANRKLVFVASALGSQLVAYLFKRSESVEGGT